jgi:hypothetical protein
MRRLLGIVGAGLLAAACAPGAPPGVDKAKLDEAVSRAIGDPMTCVMIAEAGTGRVVYRYNTASVCARTMPACEGAGERGVGDLVALTAKDGKVRTLSCDTTVDGSRGVGWAAGPIAGKPLVYAAAMEGERGFPGRIMAERLERGFKAAGL